jgi:hypothetical protein
MRLSPPIVATLMGLVVAVTWSCRGDIDSGWLSRTVTTSTGIHRYAVFVPPGRPPEGGWPVLLYFHGGDGRGTDGIKHTEGEFGAVIRQSAADWPMVIVFPQSDTLLVSPNDENLGLGALEQVEAEVANDPRRTYWRATLEEPTPLGTWHIDIRSVSRRSGPSRAGSIN